jgi:hypothetical protein
MNFARDNYYKSCPSVMDYSQFTDYRTPSTREEYGKFINNITSEHEYRHFLQQNASKILDTEWNLITKTYNCQPNQCIHYSPVRQPEGDQYAEFTRYNTTRAGKENSTKLMCPKYSDYRMN